MRKAGVGVDVASPVDDCCSVVVVLWLWLSTPRCRPSSMTFGLLSVWLSQSMQRAKLPMASSSSSVAFVAMWHAVVSLDTSRRGMTSCCSSCVRRCSRHRVVVVVEFSVFVVDAALM